MFVLRQFAQQRNTFALISTTCKNIQNVVSAKFSVSSKVFTNTKEFVEDEDYHIKLGEIIEKNKHKIHYKKFYPHGKELETKTFLDKMAESLTLKQENILEDLNKEFPPIYDLLHQNEEYVQLPYMVDRIFVKSGIEGVHITPPYGAVHTVISNAFFSNNRWIHKNKNDVSFELKHKWAQMLGWCEEILASPSGIDEDPLNLHFLFEMPMAEQATYHLLKKLLETNPELEFKMSTHFHQAYTSYQGSCSSVNAWNDCFDKYGTEKMSELGMEHYVNIRKSQHGIYPLYLPISTAAIINGLTDPKMLRKLLGACEEVMLHSVIEQDFKEAFPALFPTEEKQPIEKWRSEAAKGRPSWIYFFALEFCGEEESEVLMKHYGKKDEESENLVQKVYTEIGLFDEITKWEKFYFTNTAKMINDLPNQLPKNHLQEYLEMSTERIADILN